MQNLERWPFSHLRPNTLQQDTFNNRLSDPDDCNLCIICITWSCDKGHFYLIFPLCSCLAVSWKNAGKGRASLAAEKPGHPCKAAVTSVCRCYANQASPTCMKKRQRGYRKRKKTTNLFIHPFYMRGEAGGVDKGMVTQHRTGHNTHQVMWLHGTRFCPLLRTGDTQLLWCLHSTSSSPQLIEEVG